MRSPAFVRRLAVALITSLLSSAPLAAANPDNTTTAAPPPTANYTDHPRTETYSTTPYYHQGLTSPSYHSSASHLPGNFGSVTVYRPDVILFPPPPPALGDAVPSASPLLLRNQPVPPPDYELYVHEIFAPQIGTLLYHNDLPKRWRVQVENYRVSRDAAVEALRARIESARSQDPAGRTNVLAAFAREQQPTLEALETEAERIRDLLTNGTFFTEGTDWNHSRRWRLGDDTQWESNHDELRVLRAATFYQKGLSADQRDLLREMALELSTLLEDPLAEINLSGPGPGFYFSPSPARLRLPANLPDSLAQQLARYRDEKTVLKRELRDAIYHYDRTWFASRRVNALRALAEQQAPRFAALEATAERLRQELHDLIAFAPGVSVPGMPPELHARIQRYMNDKADLQDTLTRKLSTMRAELPFDRIEFARLGGGYGIVHVPSRQTKRSRRPAEVDADLSAFNTIQVARFEELARERAKLHTEVLQVAETLLAGSPSRTIDSLLQQFDRNVQLQQRWSRYQDYQDATLLPGLSASQRRLLFAAGVARLQLPLVNGQR